MGWSHGPWSLVLVLVLVPWSLAMVHGPGPCPGPWSLVPGPGPWSLASGPWYQGSIRRTGFSPIGSIWELWRYSDHHPTQNFNPHHSRRVPGPVEAILASKIEKTIEGVSSKIMKIRTNGDEMAPYGPVFGQDEAY